MPEWVATVKRAGREMSEDHMSLMAKALAFGTFLAIPSLLLVAVGLFTLIANPHAIGNLITHLHQIMPSQARQLLSSSLHRLGREPATSLVMTVVGFGLAIWSTTGAMTNYMTALDIAYDRNDERSFVKRRLVALSMAACVGLAVLLITALWIFGHTLEQSLGRVIDEQSLITAIWSVLRWAFLLFGLLVAFAAMLYLGPDVDQRSWRLVRPGALVAAVVWLAGSGVLALYASDFHAYNKSWGSLAAVIVVLIWLWLGSLALLFGAELDAELEAPDSAATD